MRSSIGAFALALARALAFNRTYAHQCQLARTRGIRFKAKVARARASSTTRASSSRDARDAITERFDDLERAIAAMDDEYYVKCEPSKTDEEYDALRRELESLCARRPELRARSRALANVGFPLNDVAKSRRLTHARKMLSLSNAFRESDVEEFAMRVRRMREARGASASVETTYCVEPKIDGASASVRYERGKLTSIASRGDGYEGEDVTSNVIRARGVPRALRDGAPAVVEIRGEVHVSEEDFIRVNAEREALGLKVFKSARNAAAGAMRMVEAEDNQMPLRFLAYGWGAVGESDDAEDDTPWSTQSEFLREFLPANGFDPVPCLGVATTVDELLEAHAALELARPTMPYHIDGVVYKVNDVELQSALGADARQPRWAIAHKFTAMSGVTTLRAIEVQVGRTGALTPVAVLDSVDIAGASISRATLHNFDEIARKRLRIGAKVVVERAGDVIPHVVALAGDDVADATAMDPNAKPLAEWLPPTRCPDCGSSVVRAPLSSSKGTMGTIVRCTGGLRCPSQSLERLLHFCARDALDISGLARATLETLHSEGVVKTPADIFTLERRFGPKSGTDAPSWWRYAGVKNAKGDIKQGSDGLKQSALKLFDSIELCRKGVPLHRFIFALGIPNIGAHTAKVLATHYGTLAAFKKASLAAASDGPQGLASAALTAIDGVGPVIAQSLTDFWAEPANVKIVDEILAAGVNVLDAAAPKSQATARLSPPPTPPPLAAVVSSPETLPSVPSTAAERADLRSMKILFTGVVEGLSREDVIDIIERHGGVVQSALSRKTAVVIAGVGAGPSKLAKARELGVEIVDARQFLDALAAGRAPVSR